MEGGASKTEQLVCLNGKRAHLNIRLAIHEAAQVRSPKSDAYDLGREVNVLVFLILISRFL